MSRLNEKAGNRPKRAVKGGECSVRRSAVDVTKALSQVLGGAPVGATEAHSEFTPESAWRASPIVLPPASTASASRCFRMVCSGPCRLRRRDIESPPLPSGASGLS